MSAQLWHMNKAEAAWGVFLGVEGRVRIRAGATFSHSLPVPAVLPPHSSPCPWRKAHVTLNSSCYSSGLFGFQMMTSYGLKLFPSYFPISLHPHSLHPHPHLGLFNNSPNGFHASSLWGATVYCVPTFGPNQVSQMQMPNDDPNVWGK